MNEQPNPRQLSGVSREELYNLIWSTPATKLGAEFGVSDVAVHKRCIKLNVPRPSRGYWAKRAAGQKPPKKRLPPTADAIFAKEARRSVGKTLSLPEQSSSLLPLASELLSALTKAKLDDFKRTRLKESTLPEVAISKPLAEKAAKAFHVILTGVEPVGICFRKALSASDHGYFKRGQDRLCLSIQEDIVDSSGSRLQIPSWQPKPHRSLSGNLTFSLISGQYETRIEKKWSESCKVPLEKLLARIVRAIRRHFLEMQNRHIQEAIEAKRRQDEWERQMREWEAAEAIRLQKEKERKHASALARAAEARKEDLIAGAESWRLSIGVKEFINECEKRWKSASDHLTDEQQDWLKWAREITKSPSRSISQML